MNKKIGILILHGFTANPSQLKDLKKFLLKKGFIVRTPLIAGHDDIRNKLIKTTTDDWKRSVKKSYLQLKKETSKIFIIGNSFGSNLGLWLVKEFNNEPAGIITLNAPIFLKYHNFILFRLNTYGLFKKYYYKPKKVYKSFWVFLKSVFLKFKKNINGIFYLNNCQDDIIPVKSFRQFLKFIKKETKKNLSNIKVPIFITHSLLDTVVEPKSANFIYKNISSEKKHLYWFESSCHVILNDEKKEILFEKIYNFIIEN